LHGEWSRVSVGKYELNPKIIFSLPRDLLATNKRLCNKQKETVSDWAAAKEKNHRGKISFFYSTEQPPNELLPAKMNCNLLRL